MLQSFRFVLKTTSKTLSFSRLNTQTVSFNSKNTLDAFNTLSVKTKFLNGVRLKRPISTSILSVALMVALGFSQSALADDANTQQRVLNIYNWSDYIAPNTIADFEAKTGIKVVYDVFDSNELLESKLMAGNTGFDLVVPTSNFLAKQIEIGVYQPLDKSKLTEYDNLDPKMLELLAKDDPDNTYSLPYMWATSGLGFNKAKMTEIFGENLPTDSWALIFDEENAKKLKSCGITWLNDPTEMFSVALNYLGLDPNSSNPDDYKKASELLAKVRPYVRYLHSSSYISDLANGDVCVSVGYGGDIYQSAARAKEANNGVTIEYSVPKEGTVASFDVFAIPKDAKNIDEAYEFLNYLLEPQVIANISNYVFYANANLKATALMDKALTEDKNIYPPDDVKAKIFSLTVKEPKVERAITRAWTDVLTTK